MYEVFEELWKSRVIVFIISKIVMGWFGVPSSDLELLDRVEPKVIIAF